MFCKNCGKEIKDGTKFCEFCGAGQENVQPIEQSSTAAVTIAILKIITSDQQQKTILCNQKARL